jgi:hypothetical protein
MLHNKLIPRRARATKEITGGVIDEIRISGRTTAIALRMLARAIEEPRILLDLRDHSHDGQQPTIEDNRNLGRLVSHMAVVLGLKYINVINTTSGAMVASDHMTSSIWDLP